MIGSGLPFQWGPAAPAVAPPAPPAPPLWGKVTASGTWTHGTGATRTPRFEHVYAQVPGAQRSQNLVHRVQSQYAFLIATGDAVVVASALSTP